MYKKQRDTQLEFVNVKHYLRFTLHSKLIYNEVNKANQISEVISVVNVFGLCRQNHVHERNNLYSTVYMRVLFQTGIHDQLNFGFTNN